MSAYYWYSPDLQVVQAPMGSSRVSVHWSQALQLDVPVLPCHRVIREYWVQVLQAFVLFSF